MTSQQTTRDTYSSRQMATAYSFDVYTSNCKAMISMIKATRFDVITSIVSFLWAYTTAARDVTGERVRTAYDVTAACYHKRRTQRIVFCHTWY